VNFIGTAYVWNVLRSIPVYTHTHTQTHTLYSRKSSKYKKTAKMPEVCAEGKMKRFLKALAERKSTQK
jgi:hypothetical protein